MRMLYPIFNEIKHFPLVGQFKFYPQFFCSISNIAEHHLLHKSLIPSYCTYVLYADMIHVYVHMHTCINTGILKFKYRNIFSVYYDV